LEVRLLSSAFPRPRSALAPGPPTPIMLLRLVTCLPKARRWLASTLAEHRAAARAITELDFPRIREFFPADVLQHVRVVVVDCTPKPPLEQWGLHGVDDFGAFDAAGITLDDFIFIRRGGEHDESLHFHELIHVIQWRVLGLNRFLALYGLHLLEHGYINSPLEVMAYGMQEMFDHGRQSFDADVIARRRTQEVFATSRKRSLLHRVTFTLIR
jgi:hypothetical protein